jgi:hypothetical protein
MESILGAKDREVFLMYGSGTRAGYAEDALESLGYETLYNVGGIRNYNGDHSIIANENLTLALRYAQNRPKTTNKWPGAIRSPGPFVHLGPDGHSRNRVDRTPAPRRMTGEDRCLSDVSGDILLT